jgi:hypothetical protein
MSTGFSRRGMVFFIFTIRSAFFRSLFSPCGSFLVAFSSISPFFRSLFSP